MYGRQGGRVGAEAGRLFRAVTGFGDYKVNRNSLLTATDRLPSFRNHSAGTSIQHREFLGDVITASVAGGFKITTYPIQPALLGSFPWLSASAENYQEYRLNGCIYEFKSNSYNALSSTNTAAGTVVMATNYNVLDDPFTNKFQMEQTQYVSSCKPSENLMHPIECAKLETPTSILFTRSNPSAPGDFRLYDWGNFSIATVGQQGTSTNIGELWVTYDITLLKPKLNGIADVYDHYILQVLYFVPGGPGYFGTTSSGHPALKTQDSDMGTYLTNTANPNSQDTINWPAGYYGKVAVIYRSEIKSTAAASLATPYAFVPSAGVTGITAFANGTATTNEGLLPMVYNANGGTTLIIFLEIKNGGSLQFTGGTTAGTSTSGDLIILALPSNFVTNNLPVLSSSPSDEKKVSLPLFKSKMTVGEERTGGEPRTMSRGRRPPSQHSIAHECDDTMDIEDWKRV